MENTRSTGRSTPVAVYYTKRRTPSARGKSWVGTLLFIFSFPALFVLAAMNAGRSALLIPGIMILGGIIFWIISGVEQNGTISFYDNKIVHKCRREVFELYPGQVSSVSQSGKVVKIIFSGKTLLLYRTMPTRSPRVSIRSSAHMLPQIRVTQLLWHRSFP